MTLWPDHCRGVPSQAMSAFIRTDATVEADVQAMINHCVAQRVRVLTGGLEATSRKSHLRDAREPEASWAGDPRLPVLTENDLAAALGKRAGVRERRRADYFAGSRALMKSAIRLAAGGSRFDSTAIV
jgi:hypothetical protein